MNRVLPFVPGGILLIGALLISGIREQHTVKSVAPMSAVSSRFADTEGRSQVIDSVEQQVAGMTDYSLRQFGPDSNWAFSVYVGYYEKQVQGKSIHSPKNCLPGAGWDILTASRIASPSGTPAATVNRVVLSLKGTRALVYYWYQGRGRVEASEYKVKWNLLRDAALFGRTEETLVRIVVPVKGCAPGSDAGVVDVALQDADKIARTVAAQLEKEVLKVLPAAPAT